MTRKRWAATVALFGLLVTTLAAAPGAVYASEKGRKNTALALGAATVYSLLKGKTTQGLVLGAGGVYAYKKYKDTKEENRARQSARRGYVAGYRAARYR
jgi:hypothetical protein